MDNLPIAILLALLALHSMADIQKPTEYMNKLAKRMVEIVEAIPISGDAFPLRSFENKFNVTELGLSLVGSVRFHSGFIAQMESAELIPTSHENRITSTAAIITATFWFRRVQTVYDTTYNVIGFTQTGAFTLLYVDIVYEIQIQRKHADGAISAKITFQTVNRDRTPGKKPGQYGMTAKGYPDNGYTQLVCKEMMRQRLLRDELEKSYVDWQMHTLQPALERAVRELGFPEIRYYM